MAKRVVPSANQMTNMIGTPLKLIVSAATLLCATEAFGFSTGYSVAVKFGGNETDSTLTSTDVAGVPAVSQANWNTVNDLSGSLSGLVADNNGQAINTGASVSWAANGTWASVGHPNESNNRFPTNSADRALMTGYLDTGDATTTRIAISGIPPELAANGYDVYVYALASVARRGGGYRILNTNGVVLKDYLLGDSSSLPTTYVQDQGLSHNDIGDYLVFKGLVKATDIIIEATTANGLGRGTPPRAPVNAVQLVADPLGAQLVLGYPAGTGLGFTIGVTEVGNAVADTNSIALAFNGTNVTPALVSRDANGITTIGYQTPTPPLASGSTNTVGLTIKDLAGNSYSTNRTFTLPSFVTVPPNFALAPGVVDTNLLGFRIRTVQVADNQATSVAATERLLAGLAGDNIADLTGVGADGYFLWTNVINFDINDAVAHGYFNTDQGYPDAPFPGITANSANQLNFACEVLAAVEFPAPGIYTMVVNSDDGFRTTVAANPLDAFATMLGQFDGGRGAADTAFSFFIPKAGVFPLRTIYEQGQGDANLEWFTLDAGGRRLLINDTSTNGFLRAYPWLSSTAPAYVRLLDPANGDVRTGVPAQVTAILVDAGTKIDPASVKLQLNGAAVTANAVKSNDVTTVTYTPNPPLMTTSVYTATLTYADTSTPPVSRTVQWSFKTGPLPLNSYLIEAEDFDYDGGKTMDVASVMPYYGGAYSNLAAVWGVDFRNNDSLDSTTATAYRDYSSGDLSTKLKSVDITDNYGGLLGHDRGAWNVNVNYRIGWVDSGEWQNYTRTIPAGNYTAFAALSSGNKGDTIGGSLGIVTSGVGTASQTITNLGRFTGSAPGGWGNNGLVPFRASNGTPVFALPGGKTTIRFTMTAGDFDFFVLAPIPPAPALLAFESIALQGNNVVITWTNTTATLQSSSVVNGPWTNAPGATSPLTVPVAGDPQRFYRLQQ